ncbi:MAG: hypothetical protein K6G86_07835 [Bacteroidales bacterium]|nr:hypothetical protein [Bacteroidales bacterium]
MDWTQIVIAALGLIGVVDFGRILFFKERKKKEGSEADNIAIKGLKESIVTLESRIASDQEAMERKDAKIEALYDEKNTYREDLASSQTLMCVHLGCAARKPAQGQGAEWLRDHKSDPSLGVDYLPINQLMKLYGKQKAEKEKEAEQDA